MNPYKHYSFDLWMTLIKSNPSFKRRRAEYFFENYNSRAKSMEEVLQVFRQVDLMCNAINEKTGSNIDAEEMYLMVIYLLSNEAVTLYEVDTTSLYARMEGLVLENLPELYDSTTPQVLNEIKSREAVTISLLSNTAFIKGSTLRKVLRELGLQQYFDFEIYSDEVGMSKPNIKIFELMLKNVQSLRNETLAPGEILHIGDNEIADIAAATKMGIAAYQVNSNHQLITDLLR